MSVTLATITILIFLIPGLICRKAFFILPFEKRFMESNPLSEMGMVLLMSLCIQFLGSISVINFQSNWEAAGNELINAIEGSIFEKNKSETDSLDLHSLLVYQLILWLIAAGIGFFFNGIIRYFKWDRKSRILRFGNSWYYYLSGEAVEFPDMNGNASEIDFVFADVLIKAKNQEILYTGLLSDYELSSNGGLKSIALKGVKRRFLNGSEYESNSEIFSRGSNPYYTVPSDLFVIPFNSEVVNINLRYYQDDVPDKGKSDNLSLVQWIIMVISLAIVVIGVTLIFKRLNKRTT